MRRIFKTDVPEADQVPAFLKILDDLSVGNNVFLVGAAGTGKSTLAEKIAYAYQGRSELDGKALPFVSISCNQWTSPTDLKGGQTMEGYKEGGMIEAWRDGKILILDEMPKLDPNTAGILNGALAKSAQDAAIIFNGMNQPVAKHPDFGCIASGNVIGKGYSSQYVGNNKQDASLLDRFSGSIYHVGFNKALEEALIYAPLLRLCWDIRKAILTYEGKQQAQDDTEDLMTLRTMLNLQRNYVLEMQRETGQEDTEGHRMVKVNKGKTLKDALESLFFVMNPDKAEKIREAVNIEGFYNSYLGKELKMEFLTEYKRRVS